MTSLDTKKHMTIRVTCEVSIISFHTLAKKGMCSGTPSKATIASKIIKKINSNEICDQASYIYRKTSELETFKGLI